MKQSMNSPVMLQTTTTYLNDPCRIPPLPLLATDSWEQCCLPKEFWLKGHTKIASDYTETLPQDPRQWTRQDVAHWLHHVTTRHHLPEVQLDRFLMNGKALCLMTIDMFVQRVPLGGKLLYKDFQLRLSNVLYS
ncbi:ets DNA-binding protein pokkuri [Centruroides vittatus]|uniref:ets DNA-binding protein pokkuri n=1 Tax=Centruroides vittatus TaxID=120091 RepID=UPI000C6DFE97|nr:ets DNA-binding protein pokkuri-like isoform X2 [Centruroides sculpturatus]